MALLKILNHLQQWLILKMNSPTFKINHNMLKINLNIPFFVMLLQRVKYSMIPKIQYMKQRLKVIKKCFKSIVNSYYSKMGKITITKQPLLGLSVSHSIKNIWWKVVSLWKISILLLWIMKTISSTSCIPMITQKNLSDVSQSKLLFKVMLMKQWMVY